VGYDFSTLSPDDFEILVGDLLSREWGVPIEFFKSGRDRGIDLRYAAAEDAVGTTIVQCKRYGAHRYGALVANLEIEKSKVAELAPARYVVATTVPLNPQQKEKLFSLLSPWCRATQDILGADDINALIRRHPSVERNHFKLWISSTGVLETIIHSKIFATTDDELETLKLELSKLVVHDGLDRAMRILDDEHHVVVVGNPGIGKTTLARMLLADLVGNGFEPIVVSSSIDDAWAVLHAAEKRGSRIAIFYDDFLGRIRFDAEKFEKNEESSLLRLMDRVRRSADIRFILTTREYILADAQRIHGAFAARAKELVLCTVSLGDYTRTKRAQILFNHLYFSDLPDSRLASLVEAKAYRTIVAHRHFNPRVVETVCRNGNSRTMGDAEFVAYVESEFENPASIWELSFRNDISPEARLVLAFLWSFGGAAELESLRDCVLACGNDGRPEELSLRVDEAVRQLDGNFISTALHGAHDKDPGCIVATFNNPSVEEFAADWLQGQPEFLKTLATGAVDFEQLSRISVCVRRGQLPDGRRRQLWATLRTKATQRLRGHTGRFVNFDDGAGGYRKTWWFEDVSAARANLIRLRIEREHGPRDALTDELERDVLSRESWSMLLEGASSDYRIPQAIRSLCDWIEDESGWEQSKIQDALVAYAMALIGAVESGGRRGISLSSLEDLVSAASTVLGKVGKVETDILAQAVHDSIDDAMEDPQDAGWLNEEADNLERIQELLTVDFGKDVERLRDAAHRLEDDKSPRRATEVGNRYAHSDESFDLDNYFAELSNR
jgi:hypothetical protein